MKLQEVKQLLESEFANDRVHVYGAEYKGEIIAEVFTKNNSVCVVRENENKYSIRTKHTLQECNDEFFAFIFRFKNLFKNVENII